MPAKRRILTIDGGGIKGVLPAAFLAMAEAKTGKRIVDHFDLIAGTSTGGIIALGLGLGLSAQEILEFYLVEGPKIFDQELQEPMSAYETLVRTLRGNARSARQFFMSKYGAQQLRVALLSAFGDRKLGDASTRLVIPAYHPLRREVYVFKTGSVEIQVG